MSTRRRLLETELWMVAAAIWGPRQGETLHAAEPDDFLSPEVSALWAGMRGAWRDLGALDEVVAVSVASACLALVERAKALAQDVDLRRVPSAWKAARALFDAGTAAQAFIGSASTCELETDLVVSAITNASRALEGVGSRIGRGGAVGLIAALEAARKREKDGAGALVVGTGITELDRRIGGGLNRGSLTGIMARSGHGKSSLALTWAVDAAAKGLRVLYVTREMPAEEMALRALATHLDEHVNLVRQDMMRPGVLDEAADLPIEFEDRERNLAVIQTRCEAAADEGAGYDLVALDFLQVLTAPGKDPFERLENGAYIAKDIALRAKCAVLLLVQPNREGTKAERLSAHHMRGSSAIENACDSIVTLARDEPLMPGAAYPLDLSVVKARNGETGDIMDEVHLGAGTFRVYAGPRMTVEEIA